MKFSGGTVGDLMALWGEIADFAAAAGVTVKHARTMRDRNSVAVDYWPAIVADARRRGIAGVTYESLTLMHARRPLSAHGAEVHR